MKDALVFLGKLLSQSSSGEIHETIVPRVSRVPHVPPRHRQSAKHKASHCTAACKSRSSVKWGCALRVVERRPLFCDSVVKDQFGSFLCHFASAKHIFKASVACNGREVLHGRVPENTSRPALCGASPWGGFLESK